MMRLKLSTLAKQCDVSHIDGHNTVEITAAADIMTAEQNQITVLSNPKYARYLSDCSASACFIATDFKVQSKPESLTLLRCPDPEISFLKAVNLLHPAIKRPHTIAPQAVIADSARIGDSVHIAAFASLDEESCVGDETIIHHGAYIGRQVTIGQRCCIHPNVVIYDKTHIGDNVIIHAGSVIGADGFGYKYRDNQHIKVPHVGNVVIEDQVEIGANTCIDRGALGSTVIGAGSKIDNLVQLGHNNQVGRNVIICGQSGISGSCPIGDGAVLAGSSGIADHVTIGQQAVVMARAGVASDIKPATQVFGSPAKERKVAWKELAALAKLPELLRKIKRLEKRIRQLESSSG